MYGYSASSICKYFQRTNTLSHFKLNLKNFWKRSQHSNVVQADKRSPAVEEYRTSIEECMPTFYNILDELSTGNKKDPEQFFNRLNKVFLYNVPKGKKIRVRTMVTAYKVLQPVESLTPEKLQLAYILGWCIELVNAFTLIQDDIMDASQERRGVPCWYLVENIGLRAINDSLMIENQIFRILKNHFRDHPCYKPAMQLLHKTAYIISLGQCLDNNLRPSLDKKLTLNDIHTREKYNALIKYKSVYCVIELPILLALHLSGRYEKNAYEQIRIILMEMGAFFQIQNDFWDCFGDKSKTGKDGTDIQEGKCTWLLATALQNASRSQRKVLEDNYGRSSPENVCNVMDIYRELKIPELYYNYSNNIDNIISSYIDKYSHNFPEALFTSVIDIVCKSEFRK